jgi:hypothetical protein
MARCVYCQRKKIRVPDMGMDPQFVANVARSACSVTCARLAAERSNNRARTA